MDGALEQVARDAQAAALLQQDIHLDPHRGAGRKVTEGVDNGVLSAGPYRQYGLRISLTVCS